MYTPKVAGTRVQGGVLDSFPRALDGLVSGSLVTGERPWTLSKLIECDMTLEHLCASDSCPSD